MSTLFWRHLDDFYKELPGADDQRLVLMQKWAAGREASANQSGMGRSPKARRKFRLLREAAEAELTRRGLA